MLIYKIRIIGDNLLFKRAVRIAWSRSAAPSSILKIVIYRNSMNNEKSASEVHASAYILKMHTSGWHRQGSICEGQSRMAPGRG